MSDARTAQIKLVALSLQTGQYDQADTLLKELDIELGAGTDKSRANRSILVEWLHLKSAYYEKTGRSKQAYAFLEQYTVLRSSLNEQEWRLKNADMEKAFTDIRQDYQQDMLRKYERLKTYSLSVVIACSILALTLLGFGYSLKRYRGTNRQMARQNSQMRYALEALEQSQADNTRMMQIVAHDLRNPVGAIYSLSTMMPQEQGRSEEDWEMLELLITSSQNLQTPVKLTTVGRFKLTTPGRSKLTMLGRAKLTT